MTLPVVNPIVNPTAQYWKYYILGNYFTPTSLFSSGEVGAWFDATKLNYMYQDTAKTIPAAINSKVALILDTSPNGNNAVQSQASYQPTLLTHVNNDPYLYFFTNSMAIESLPAGTYTIAHLTYSGTQIYQRYHPGGIFTIQSVNFLYYLVINRSLTTSETNNLTTFFNASFKPDTTDILRIYQYNNSAIAEIENSNNQQLDLSFYVNEIFNSSGTQTSLPSRSIFPTYVKIESANGPSDVYSLPSLSTFGGEFPDFAEFKNLTYLNAQDIESGGGLMNLRGCGGKIYSLNINAIGITCIIPDLSQNTGISTLTISNTYCSGIEAWPPNISNATLTANSLYFLPDMSNLQHLTNLNLSNNFFSTLPILPPNITQFTMNFNTSSSGLAWWSTLPSTLTNLSLLRSNIVGDADFSSTPKLSVLNLNSTNVSTITNLPTSLTSFDYGGASSLTSTPITDYSTYTNLTTLSISVSASLPYPSNYPSNIQNLTITYQPNLGTYAVGPAVQTDFSMYTKLSILQINGNPENQFSLPTLPSAITQLSINNMSLAGTLPDISTYTNMTYLSLQNCQLSSYSSTNAAPINLNYVYLQGNSFDSASIDAILYIFYLNLSSRPTYGFIELTTSSGTNPPSATGTSYINAIEAHGWHVYVDA